MQKRRCQRTELDQGTAHGRRLYARACAASPLLERCSASSTLEGSAHEAWDFCSTSRCALHAPVFQIAHCRAIAARPTVWTLVNLDDGTASRCRLAIGGPVPPLPEFRAPSPLSPSRRGCHLLPSAGAPPAWGLQIGQWLHHPPCTPAAPHMPIWSLLIIPASAYSLHHGDYSRSDMSLDVHQPESYVFPHVQCPSCGPAEPHQQPPGCSCQTRSAQHAALPWPVWTIVFENAIDGPDHGFCAATLHTTA